MRRLASEQLQEVRRFICEECGSTYSRTRYARAGKYCNLSCANKAGWKKRLSTFEVHFWSKVNVVNDDYSCWEVRNAKGYGRIRHDGKADLTHRVSWRLFSGEIPEGMYVLHMCDNPPCVRPSHLFIGTPADNIHDREAKGRGPTGERSGPRKHPERYEAKKGSEHYKAKVTEDDVVEIRRLREVEKLTFLAIANRYGVTYRTIVSIVQRRTWKHVA